ncbi:hypothetical protein [Nocardia huaxiensis]|uniref:Uncharacterized protein n=1 Tax=Nocardia huaxiensis TaxID=2755382 RepID=A0A7D6ZRP6_9NOCA|nr:hypothetical protein [Nocardia huaxiensis]QLY33723.1 hypothetical protein H0264_17120 [Nocardia huaxiensis]UFS99354.1 hypothetical protein LPY97_16400 [Nocardia huaxiensis]
MSAHRGLTVAVAVAASIVTAACTTDQLPDGVQVVTTSPATTAPATDSAPATTSAVLSSADAQPVDSSGCVLTDPAVIDQPLSGGWTITDLTAGAARARVWSADANGTQYFWARAESGYLTATWGQTGFENSCARAGAVSSPAVPWKLPAAGPGSLPNLIQFCLSDPSAAEPACWSTP